jgi:anti-sigma regulatory factor (Ser/Thr protein kinase)
VIIGGWRGPGWRLFGARREQVKEARDWIRLVLTSHDCPVDPDGAALATSELVGNAVLYGPAGGRVLVGYCLWSEGARLVVCDGGGPTTAQPRENTGSLSEGGRGLNVVQSLTVRWGSFRTSQTQAVWCDFGQELRAPASDTWAWLHAVLGTLTLAGTSSCRTAAAVAEQREPPGGSVQARRQPLVRLASQRSGPVPPPNGLV